MQKLLPVTIPILCAKSIVGTNTDTFTKSFWQYFYTNIFTDTFNVVASHHRLRGSASPVLTVTHHSYGSPRLSDFFPSRLWGSDPSTDIHAKCLKRRVFTQGCAFCSKSRYFSYPLISSPPKRSKFCKFLDLENFRDRIGL